MILARLILARLMRTLLLLTAIFSLLAAGASAQTFKYAAINYPTAKSTMANGINNSNVIVGSYVSTTNHTHGFRYQNGRFSYINVPNSTRTTVSGINDYGDAVGSYSLAGTSAQPANSHGFLLHSGVIKTIDCPNSPFTFALGINKYGTIVGTCETSKGDLGFIYKNGTFSYLNAPTDGTPTTQVNGISNTNELVGQVFSGDDWRGFFKVGSDLDFLKPLYSLDNMAEGVNSHGDVVGCASGAKAFVAYSAESGETSESSESYPKLHTFAPFAALNSCAMGINYGGAIVGWYYDASNVQRGFLALKQ